MYYNLNRTDLKSDSSNRRMSWPHSQPSSLKRCRCRSWLVDSSYNLYWHLNKPARLHNNLHLCCMNRVHNTFCSYRHILWQTNMYIPSDMSLTDNHCSLHMSWQQPCNNPNNPHHLNRCNNYCHTSHSVRPNSYILS